MLQGTPNQAVHLPAPKPGPPGDLGSFGGERRTTADAAIRSIGGKRATGQLPGV